MYMPDLFAVNDRQTQIDFIRTSGWGYLTGVIDDEPYVTHLPFLVTGGTGEETRRTHGTRQPALGEFCQRQTSTRRLSGATHTILHRVGTTRIKPCPRGTIQRRMSTARPSS